MIVHSTYPDDPMQVLCIFRVSNIGGRYPLGLLVSTVELNRLRRQLEIERSYPKGTEAVAKQPIRKKKSKVVLMELLTAT